MALRALAVCGAISRETGLTCAGRTDGGGAQVLATMTVMAYCRNIGIKYYHTPVQTIEHATVATGPQEWESLFSLGTGESRACECGLPIVTLRKFLRRPLLWRRPCVIQVKHFTGYMNTLPDPFSSIAEEIRSKYRGAARNVAQNASVAVHIRRGDVSHSGNSGRYTSNEAVARTVACAMEHLRRHGRGLDCAIYSQGQESDFRIFRDLGCKLRLNEEPTDTIQSLISADVLIQAKSAFSYLAGLLNKGIVIFEPFVTKGRKDWKPIDACGNVYLNGVSLNMSN